MSGELRLSILVCVLSIEIGSSDKSASLFALSVLAFQHYVDDYTLAEGLYHASNEVARVEEDFLIPRS